MARSVGSTYVYVPAESQVHELIELYRQRLVRHTGLEVGKAAALEHALRAALGQVPPPPHR